MDVTANNQWVNSYLEALLSTGLSFEYLHNNNNNNSSTVRDSLADEDQATVAAFYLHQILSLDEENIRNAYFKASTSARTTLGPQPAERDARIEYLSWRVWGMKRRRAEVSAAVDAHRRQEADEAEDLEEIDATTLMTIDELNSTAMADFDDLKPFDSGTQDGVSSVGDDVPALGADVSDLGPGASEPASGSTSGGVKATDVSPLVMPPPTLRLPSLSSGAKGSSQQGPARANLGAASPGLMSPFASVPPSPALHSRKANNMGGLDVFRAAWHQGVLPPPSPGATPGGTFATGPGPDTLLVNRFPRLYVLLISLHGLVRGEKMELGKDPDTGGQVKYVVELAKALGQFPSVARVDLLTRLIDDPKVDKSYAEPEERLNLAPLPVNVQAGLDAHASEHGASSHANNPATGAFIVRLPCGARNVYLRKEDLWPHVREFADRAIAHASATLARLQETGPCELYIVHGHYADAGEVAGLISSTLGVDCVLTGHSLGRNKKEHLLKSGTMGPAEVESTYAISRRIEGEERALDHAAVVFTSTQQEVAQQWGTYDGYSDELSAALQLRPCKGYHVPRMAVIPPGLDFSNLKVQMPVDPWEEILGVNKVSTPAPATPTGLDPHLSEVPSVGGPPTPSLHEGSIMTPPSAVESATDLSSNTTPPAVEDGQSSGSGGHAGRHPSSGALRSTAVSHTRGGLISPAATPTRLSYHGASTPTTLASSSALANMNPSRMAALLVGESEPGIWKEINKFLRYPGRPVILAMARPDAKKNLIGLLKAYGNSRLLRDLANLVLVMGNRDKIDSMAPGSTRVLTDVLKLVDQHDLYGYVAYPKKHTQADISDIYLLAAATRGVFVNVALQEPFGLTLIEAAAHGVPIVATTHGGPVDIISTLSNGILVEPTDTNAIANALVTLITGQKRWDEASESGRRNITAYSWPSHCARYLRTVEDQKKTLANSRVATVFAHNHTKAQEPSGTHHKGPPPGARIRHTLSLSYDDLSDLARAIAVNTTSTSAAIIKDAVAVVAAAAAAGDDAAADGGADGEAVTAVASAIESSLARTSAPSVFQDLRTFSMPLSQAFISGLQRRQPRASSKQGGLNIPAPTNVAMPNVTFDGPIPEVAESETPMQSGSPKTPDTREPVDGTATPTHASDAPVDFPTAMEAKGADPVVTENNEETVNAVVSAVASDAVLDPSKWGKEQAVQSVLAAALNALNEGGKGAKGESESVGVVKRRRSGHTAKEGSGLFPTAGDQPLAPTLSFKAAQMTKTKELQPRVHTHEQFVVFNFDSTTDVKTCAPLIRALLYGSEGADESVVRTARLLAGGANKGSSAQLGVGVMCAWGTKDTRSLLHAEGLDPNALDFMVCNAGALIWHSTAPQSPQRNQGASSDNLASQDNPRLLCDDEWEHYIDWRWDDRVVKQVLGRVLDNKAGWGRLNIVRTDSSLPTGTSKKTRATSVTRAASGAGVSSNAVAVTVGLSPASSPLHFMLDVEIQPPSSTTAAQKDALSTSEVAKQLLATIRRKLRRSGLRAQLLITPREPMPSGEATPSESGGVRGGLTAIINSIAATLTRSASGNLAALNKASEGLRGFVLHITPLRCSRALALRHLSLCSRRDLANHWTVVGCPAALAPLPAGKSAPTCTTSVSGSLITLSTSPSVATQVPPVLMGGSDGEDLLAGVQRVVVLAPNKQVSAAADPGRVSGELSTLPMTSVAYPVDVKVYQAKTLALPSITEGAESGTEESAEARIIVLS